MNPRSKRFTIASTALRVSHGGFGSRPEKNMLYCASRFLRPVSSFCRSRSTSETCLDTAPSGVDEEVHERHPQLARIRHGLPVHEDLGIGGAADDIEDVAKAASVGNQELRPIAGR